MNVISTFRPALVLLAVFTILTGIAYPALITAVAGALPAQAHGSLLTNGQQVVGSSLIAQSFTDPTHFWSRPSATSPQPYNASASSGSNLGPLNPALVDAVKARVDALKAADDAAGVAPHGSVPVDLVTASASGLDPHESPAAAQYQVARVAKASGVAVARVKQLVDLHTEGPQLGFLGSARVNVLALNLALDAERNPKQK